SKLRRIGINRVAATQRGLNSTEQPSDLWCGSPSRYNQNDVNIVLEIARNHPLILQAQEEMNSRRSPSETFSTREEDTLNHYWKEQRRRSDELRQAKANYQGQIAQNGAKRRRELERFQENLYKENQEAASQKAKDLERTESLEKRLARRPN